LQKNGEFVTVYQGKLHKNTHCMEDKTPDPEGTTLSGEILTAREKVRLLPTTPGVYLMKDSQ